MFNKKNKSGKSKYVIMYSVFRANTDDYDTDDLLCTAATEDDAYEYITRKVYLDNENHYKMWCKVHDKDELTSFEEYVTTIISQDESNKYAVVKTYYTYEEIASILRGMMGYRVVGASFESELERSIDTAIDEIEKKELDKTEIDDKVC